MSLTDYLGYLYWYLTQVPTVTYCEQPIDWIIARPGAFWSNLPYLLLGLWLINNKGLARQFGVYALLIGTMSSIYDATFRLWAQHLDLIAMFLFISFLLALNIQIIWKNQLWARILKYGLPIISLLITVFIGGSVGQTLFFIISTISVLSYYLYPNKQLNWTPLYLGIGLIVVGYLFWLPDRLQVLCLDWTIFNGRAVFHYFTTATIFCLLNFYQLNKLKLDGLKI